MKILLFGGTGQLGYEIKKRAHDLNFEVVSPVTSEVNITDAPQVRYLAEQIKPSVIINAAAYTAVDRAEVEQDSAFLINRDGARFVAEAAASIQARCIHISTDYVFAGHAGERRPLREDDPVEPLSVYGRSKLEGEREVLRVAGDRALVVRTSSLYGERGANFPRTMLRLFEERGAVKVVSDQFMSPTWAGWLAESLLDLCRIECSGVLHAANRGETSWYEFAQAILEYSKHTLTRAVTIEPVTAAEFGSPTKRPEYSVLDCTRLTGLLGRPPIPWREGLRHFLHDIGIT